MYRRLEMLSLISKKLLSRHSTQTFDRIMKVFHKQFCDYSANEMSLAINQDIVMKGIKSATETSDILHCIQNHSDQLTCAHSIQALKTIFFLQKSDKTTFSNGEIIRSPGFLSVCQRIKNDARGLTLNESIDVLKALSYLGVPSSSKIISILIQLIVKQVNDLSLQQIVFLDFLVKDFKQTPLISALRIALPIVFEANLRIKVDGENVQHLCDLLRYTSRKNVSQSSVDLIIDLLMRERMKFDFKTSKSIVRSICDMPRTDESYRPLLHHALNIILENIDACKCEDMDFILFMLTKRYSLQNNYFYHEDFFKESTDLVVNEDCGFEEGVWMLRKTNKVKFVNFRLLEYLAKKLEKQPWVLETSRISILFNLIHGFSLADMKPKNWDTLEPYVLKNVSNFLKYVELPWVQFATDLAVLGTWSEELFNVIFNSDFLDDYLKRDYNLLDYLQLLSLYQSVVTLMPHYKGVLPPSSVIKKAIEVNGDYMKDYPLSGALSRLLGDSSLFLTSVYTSVGQFMDHLMILDSNNNPVAPTVLSTGSRIKIEDLDLKEGEKMVSIIYLGGHNYCVNTNRLKGSIRLAIDSLKARSLIVVPISSLSWDMLLEREKIPFLKRAIVEKCGPLSLASCA